MVLAENKRTLMRIKSVHDVEAATLPLTGLPNHLNHLSDGKQISLAKDPTIERFGDGVVHPILGALHRRYRKNLVFGSDNMVVEDALPPEQTSLRPFGLGARTSL
jgi:hypothetical protein